MHKCPTSFFLAKLPKAYAIFNPIVNVMYVIPVLFFSISVCLASRCKPFLTLQAESIFLRNHSKPRVKFLPAVEAANHQLNTLVKSFKTSHKIPSSGRGGESPIQVSGLFLVPD